MKKISGNIINKMDNVIIKMQVTISKKWMEGRFSLVGNNAGMGVIEVILIIVVLVGLAFTFKGKIASVLNTIFTKITSKVNSF